MGSDRRGQRTVGRLCDGGHTTDGALRRWMAPRDAVTRSARRRAGRRRGDPRSCGVFTPRWTHRRRSRTQVRVGSDGCRPPGRSRDHHRRQARRCPDPHQAARTRCDHDGYQAGQGVDRTHRTGDRDHGGTQRRGGACDATHRSAHRNGCHRIRPSRPSRGDGPCMRRERPDRDGRRAAPPRCR